MHPPLADHQQTTCVEVMKSLKLCHDNYPWLKFAGACNTEKHNLNLCLRGERVERTQKNAQAAKEKRAEVQKRWKEIEAES
ncbi:hypothetical protein Rhopal_006621-T1 [Rhodotorula paludigena]|uniref:COX assembly mitochondrial protein n=1 Tax=Rhodotorula paludigena TaxID=86838 RepID=A0AAV5GSU6_9BASI|nr:hypothetical protein Rhopal_006621-T1 [Rhodotorula paludigena]